MICHDPHLYISPFALALWLRCSTAVAPRIIPAQWLFSCSSLVRCLFYLSLPLSCGFFFYITILSGLFMVDHTGSILGDSRRFSCVFLGSLSLRSHMGAMLNIRYVSKTTKISGTKFYQAYSHFRYCESFFIVWDRRTIVFFSRVLPFLYNHYKNVGLANMRVYQHSYACICTDISEI